jgi:hypothetical protein
MQRKGYILHFSMGQGLEDPLILPHKDLLEDLVQSMRVYILRFAL